MVTELRVEGAGSAWRIVGVRADDDLVNEYLGYLADRNYSPRTVRAYALDLLAFCRWLDESSLALGEVSTDVLLRYLAHCRTATVAGRPGGNVYSIRDGRNVGYAPATINRRLAAISGMFGFACMRDPSRPNPCPRVERRGGPTARRARACSAIWPSPSPGRRCGCASHAACPGG